MVKAREFKQNLKRKGFTNIGYYKHIYYEYIISYCNYTSSIQFLHLKKNDSMSIL